MTIEDIHTFQELAKQNSYEYKILGQPEVRWIKIEDTYGIEVEYVRNGANNSRTHVCNYYFFNDNLFATIILSYRQDDIRKWETDFSNILCFEIVRKHIENQCLSLKHHFSGFLS